MQTRVEYGLIINLVLIILNLIGRKLIILVRNQKELSFFFKKNLVSDEIIIGMGAGAISNWMRDLRFSL